MPEPPVEPPVSPSRFSVFKSKVGDTTTKAGDSKAWKSSKKGFDWAWTKLQPVGEWANRQTGKVGAENWYPSSMDNECGKAARILWTFSKRSLRRDAPDTGDVHAARKDQKVIKSIPPRVLQDAQGLAIMTVFRTGLGWSAASGSGVVIARDTPTSWGAPSGVLVHTIGFGFVAGIDVYDAVLVLRTQKAVDAFCNPKVSLGADIAVVAGPVGSGVCVMSSFGSPDHQRPRSGSSEPCVQLRQEQGHLRWCSAHWQHCDRAPDTLFRAALTLKDENATFYGRKISAKEILRGGSVAVPEAVGVLHTVIAAAEGRPFAPEDLPDDIDIAPSDLSGGAETVEQLDAAQQAEIAPVATRKVPPAPAVPRSPREVPDPDHESEQIRPRPSSLNDSAPAIRSVPPPPVRPPRRGLTPNSPAMPDGSPRQSPRTSLDGTKVEPQPPAY